MRGMLSIVLLVTPLAAAGSPILLGELKLSGGSGGTYLPSWEFTGVAFSLQISPHDTLFRGDCPEVAAGTHGTNQIIGCSEYFDFGWTGTHDFTAETEPHWDTFIAVLTDRRNEIVGKHRCFEGWEGCSGSGDFEIRMKQLLSVPDVVTSIAFIRLIIDKNELFTGPDKNEPGHLWYDFSWNGKWQVWGEPGPEYDLDPVPLPGAFGLFGFGLAGLAAMRRVQRARAPR